MGFWGSPLGQVWNVLNLESTVRKAGIAGDESGSMPSSSHRLPGFRWTWAAMPAKRDDKFK